MCMAEPYCSSSPAGLIPEMLHIMSYVHDNDMGIYNYLVVHSHYL